MAMPARTEPVMDPSPPVTTIIRTLKVRTKVNIFGSMVASRLPSSAPPTPAKNAPRVKDKSFWRNTSIPMALAAASSSRMALNTLPLLLRISRMVTYRVKRHQPKFHQRLAWSGMPLKPRAPLVRRGRLMAKIRTISANPRVAMPR